MIIRKGSRADIDSYSALLEADRKTPTGLRGYLENRDIRRPGSMSSTHLDSERG
jgi:nicotinamidase/pyrazinamidase